MRVSGSTSAIGVMSTARPLFHRSRSPPAILNVARVPKRLLAHVHSNTSSTRGVAPQERRGGVPSLERGRTITKQNSGSITRSEALRCLRSQPQWHRCFRCLFDTLFRQCQRIVQWIPKDSRFSELHIGLGPLQPQRLPAVICHFWLRRPIRGNRRTGFYERQDGRPVSDT